MTDFMLKDNEGSCQNKKNSRGKNGHVASLLLLRYRFKGRRYKSVIDQL